MVGLISLLSYLLPVADDCYIQGNTLDAEAHAELRQMAREIALEEDLDTLTVTDRLHCIPYTQKAKEAPKTVTGSDKPIATRYCQFKNRVVSEFRIQKGAEFYEKNREILESVSQEYGINPYVMAAIFGVETNYGNFLGNANTKQALLNVYMNEAQPGKRAFFRQEFKTLIKLAAHHKLDDEALRGSWDGGFGLPQFMPTSYEHYAVSKKQSTPDLYDIEDAVYSMANYLKEAGFQADKPIAIRSEYQENVEYYDENLIKADHNSLGRMYRFLMDNQEYEYWQACENFYPVAKYNPRPHYVISIHQLAESIYERINPESS